MSVSVTFGEDDLTEQASETAGQLVSEGVPRSLAAGDPTLWGPEAEPEAAIRLGWLNLPLTSRPLLGEIGELVEWARTEGLDHVVLAGMGGSSLAPEVITGSADVPLTVLDTTDPGQVRRALEDRLESTVLVVASKSGGTVETDSHRRIYEKAFRDAGIDPARQDRRRHRPRLAAGAQRPRGGLPGDPGRPERGRPLQRPDGVRPGAQRAGGRRRRAAARRRGRGAAAAVAARGQPRPRPRRRPGRRRGRRARQARDRGRPVGDQRPARLDRAADRRVHRQVRQGHPARRGRRPRRRRRRAARRDRHRRRR